MIWRFGIFILAGLMALAGLAGLATAGGQLPANFAVVLFGVVVFASVGAILISYVLFKQMRQLEQQVVEQVSQREKAIGQLEVERQRAEVLLQDGIHRIGNALATISSLLSLQVLRSASPEVRDALDAARARVHAVAAAHRRLRVGADLETGPANDLLDGVVHDLVLNLGAADKIELIGQIEPIEIASRDAVTLGILLGELVSNAIKHAFRNADSGTISIVLKRIDGVPTLSVGDNGRGLKPGQVVVEGGLGSVVITQLAQQFGSKPRYEQPLAGGLLVVIPLPGLDAKASQ